MKSPVVRTTTAGGLGLRALQNNAKIDPGERRRLRSVEHTRYNWAQ